jgi:hypothetical protein
MTQQQRREDAESFLDNMTDSELGEFFIAELGADLCKSFLQNECRRDAAESADIMRDVETFGAIFRTEVDAVAVYLDIA